MKLLQNYLAAIFLSLFTQALSLISFTILHNGNMMGKFTEIDNNSDDCQTPGSKSCLGGARRLYHVIKQHRELEKAGKIPNVLYLLGGNIMTGSAWTYFFKDKVTAEIVNLLQPDAVNIGYHEFDYGKKNFYEYVRKLKVPIVTTNLDLSRDQEISNLFKSIIIKKGELSIGILGIINSRAPDFSSMESIGVLDERRNLDAECSLLRTKGAKIIIGIVASTYEMCKEIAKTIPLIDLVIGDNDHVLQYNGNTPSREKSGDPYPKIIVQRNGKRVPIVSAYAYSKYIGRLNITFNDDGSLVHFQGQPIFLSNDIPMAEEPQAIFDKYLTEYNRLYSTYSGTSQVYLDGDNCHRLECNFGNLVADAFVQLARAKLDYPPGSWAPAAVGLVHEHILRAGFDPVITKGNITLGNIISLLPFAMKITVVPVTGDSIKHMLEYSASDISWGQFLQVSGLYVTYDFKKKEYNRIIDVRVRCADCLIPEYYKLEKEKVYNIVTTDYMANGGHGYHMLKRYQTELIKTQVVDLDAVTLYCVKNSPIITEVQGRLKTIYQPPSGEDRIHVSCTMFLLAMQFVFMCF